jgi:alkaline phosphatase D
LPWYGRAGNVDDFCIGLVQFIMSRSQTFRFQGIDRRALLGSLGAGLAVPAFPLPGIIPELAQFKANPFSLGVASGDPADDGFVIWTRLAPDPLAFRGGMTVLPR